MTTRRWLFGDQLGPHFLDAADQPVLLSSRGRCSPGAGSTGRRRTWCCRRCGTAPPSSATSAATSAPTPTARRSRGRRAVSASAIRPRTRALRLRPNARRGRGAAGARLRHVAWPTSPRWADGRGRRAAAAGGLLPRRPPAPRRADGRRPSPSAAGGTSTPTTASRRRSRPTLGVAEPWWPDEDEIDDEVRRDLDRWERDGDVSFIGEDGPRRFAATRAEALARAAATSSPTGCRPSARTRTRCCAGDPWMAHSLLSAPMNLGLLDPLEVVAPGRAGLPGRRRRRSLGRGLRPPDHRLARLRLAPVLAAAASPTATATRCGATDTVPELVRRARRRRGRGRLPVRQSWRDLSASTAGCTTSRG